MTNGQIAQLQELEKCCFPRGSYAFTFIWAYNALIKGLPSDLLKAARLTKWQKMFLRRLWHQYRHQIKVMKKNRISAEPDDS